VTTEKGKDHRYQYTCSKKHCFVSPTTLLGFSVRLGLWLGLSLAEIRFRLNVFSSKCTEHGYPLIRIVMDLNVPCFKSWKTTFNSAMVVGEQNSLGQEEFVRMFKTKYFKKKDQR